MKENIKEFLENLDESVLIADGFDDAIIGFDEVDFRLIYSKSKIIEILKEDMSEEDALEYFYFNIQGSYVGEKTPIFCMEF